MAASPVEPKTMVPQLCFARFAQGFIQRVKAALVPRKAAKKRRNKEWYNYLRAEHILNEPKTEHNPPQRTKNKHIHTHTYKHTITHERERKKGDVGGPESLQVRKGDLDAADVDDGLVEAHHEAVRLVLEGLYTRIELHGGREPAPAFVNGAIDQSPAGGGGGGGWGGRGL